MKHDAIVKQGTNRDKIVYSQLSNIKEKKGDVQKLQAPTADEEAVTAERTRQAIEQVATVRCSPARVEMSGIDDMRAVAVKSEL